jgi:hypothetical protein
MPQKQPSKSVSWVRTTIRRFWGRFARHLDQVRSPRPRVPAERQSREGLRLDPSHSRCFRAAGAPGADPIASLSLSRTTDRRRLSSGSCGCPCGDDRGSSAPRDPGTGDKDSCHRRLEIQFARDRDGRDRERLRVCGQAGGETSSIPSVRRTRSTHDGEVYGRSSGEHGRTIACLACSTRQARRDHASGEVTRRPRIVGFRCDPRERGSGVTGGRRWWWRSRQVRTGTR